MKNRIKSFIIVILGIIIAALGFNVFLSPYHIVVGGVSGIAIILNFLFEFNESLTILILSLLLYIIGAIFLSKKEMLKTFIVSILFPLFVYLTGFLMLKVDLSVDNRFLAGIMGGVLFGFGLGIVYREGYTTGGVDIITKILNKYFNISYGTATLLLDGIVTILGAFVFGFETLVYSIITIYIYSILIDKVTLGLVGNKSFNIITSKPDDVKTFIIEELHHGVTILNGKGAYSNEKKSILFVVVPKRDYYKLKEGIKKIDKKAFFVVSSSYEVGGGKW